MMIVSRVAAGLLAALLVIAPAIADPATLTLDGKVNQPQHWTLDDLRKMPADHVDATYQTEKGPVTASFTGVKLWSLIEAAGGIDDAGKGAAAVRHAIRITATDDYVVVTSTGEISPNFGDKGTLVAYERDGKPLDHAQIVMPGDKRGGRNIHDVATITVE
jgi:DMSO/TMAO reductase YedYZ molybdopterin-dependent catalytic subunit